MKAIIKLSTVICLLAVLFSSCDKSEKAPNDMVNSSFKRMYPDAKHIEWEVEEGYYVVEFRDNGYEKEAWFDRNYEWILTKTEYERNVPEIVKNAVKSTEYNSWRIEDVDFIEMRDRDSFYIVEVEKGESDIDLYFSASGEFIKVVQDEGDYHREIFSGPDNSSLFEEVKKAFKLMYPEATRVEWELENNYYQADFYENGLEKETWFDQNASWVMTKTEYKYNIPSVVKDALNKNGYASWQIDDVEFIERKDKESFYKVEIEKGSMELDLYFSETGEFFKKE